MFTQSFHSSTDGAVTKHIHVLAKLFQYQTILNRPRLGKSMTSASPANPNIHTCHFISFREIYNHVLQTILTPKGDLFTKLAHYFSTILRRRSPQCSRAIIFIIYTLHTFDKYFMDKPRLPLLRGWAESKILRVRFQDFWFAIYNHPGNLCQNSHPRTHLTIKTRRDLVYIGGNIDEGTHSKLATKWNQDLRNLKKDESPEQFNLPVVKQDLIGKKYTSILDQTGKSLPEEVINDMFEKGWFFLSSHPHTSPRYKLPIGPDAKSYPESVDIHYYDPNNDNTNVKASSRPNEMEINPENMTTDDKNIFKILIKDMFGKDRESTITREHYSEFDCNDLPLANDSAEPMPPPNPEQSFVYCGYFIKGATAAPKPEKNSNKFLGFFKSD